MSDIASLKIGQIIMDEQHKDAIHVAIAPVVASHRLYPGQPIGLGNQGYAYATVADPCGIVDPFLTKTVEEGQKFWMFLKPGTITSLRHEWTHPAFRNASHPEPSIHTSSKEMSKTWMTHWAVKHMSEDYYGDDERISPEEAFEKAIAAGHSTHIGPYESARDFIDDEWWGHWEAITGMPGSRGEYFSCSC
jgi:hypothetical protein